MTLHRSGVVLQGVDDPGTFESYVDAIEELGYDDFWLTDSSLHTRNPYVYLTLAARRTSRLRLGTAVTNPVTRHPGITAVAAASIDEVSGGRMVLGIGVGDRPLEALGHAPAGLARLRGSIEAIRELLTGANVDHDGPGFRLSAAHLRFKTRPDIPVYISASGPKTLELAGEIADGVILLAGLHPDGIRYALDHVDRGAGRAGRARPQVVVFAYGAIDEDEDRALAQARSIAAWFPQTAPVYCEIAGLDPEIVRRVREGYSGGEFQEAAAVAELLPDDFVRRMALSGNRERTTAQLRDLAAVGVNAVSVFPLGGDRMATVRAFRECFARVAGAAP